MKDEMIHKKKKQVFAQEKNLSKLLDDTWAALKSSNKTNTSLFRFGNTISRIESDDNDNKFVKVMDEHCLRYEVARRVNFYALKGSGSSSTEEDALPPMHCIKGLISTPDKPLPILKRLVITPVFDNEGNLETDPGYSEKSKTYFIPDVESECIEISKKPTGLEIEEATRLITGDLLVDFPFVRDADKAHAIALFLLIPARNLIDGCTPLHAIDATSQGTGKGLLTNLLLGPWVNKVNKMTEASSQDEWRKRIFAKLRQSPLCIVIDNVKNKLCSSAFEAALTAENFEDRILGDSEVTAVPVKCAWIATGNNLQFDAEMARRTIRIRMDSQIEQPWLREDFKHKDIETWTKNNRCQLVWAGLTMIQAWVAAGKPAGEKTLGSYVNWSKVMGGILKVCKVGGFLENLEEFYSDSDMESNRLKLFINLWYERYGFEEIKAADLLEQVTEASIDLGMGNDRSVKTRLGTLVSSLRGKVFGNLVVTKCGLIAGRQLWRLEEKAPF